MKNNKLIIIGGVHGDEGFGVQIVKGLQKNSKFVGAALVLNTKAYKSRVRYVETDLNRSFGVKMPISYEEKLAYKIAPIIKKARLVIDIHTTKATGNSTAIIVGKPKGKLLKLVRYFGFDKVVVMSDSGSLISRNRKNSISLEYSDNETNIKLKNNLINKIVNLRLKSNDVSNQKVEIFEYIGHVPTKTFVRLKFKLGEFENFAYLNTVQVKKLGLPNGKYCPIFYKNRFEKQNMFTLIEYKGYE